MKAILRVGAVFLATISAPVVAFAQTTPTPTPTPSTTTNSQSPVAIGPADLQNFSLKGTVTRQADQPPVTTPARPQTAARFPSPASSRQAPSRLAQRAPAPTATNSTTSTAKPSIAPTLSPPPVDAQVSPALQQPAAIPSAPIPAPASTNGQSAHFSLWPWIAAAMALAAGAGFLLWRRSQREPVSAGGQYDLLVATVPEPQPQAQPQPALLRRAVTPAPAPAPRPEPSPAPPAGTVTSRLRTGGPSGIVASRLRPALELGFHPLRCAVSDDQVAIEFELELFNAGAAPARAVFAEASLLNASATQDAELQAFFSNAQGRGEPLDVIQPMKRVSFTSQVVVPRAAVHEYELAGRKAFVPVVAFNALYEWSGGGRGQSSAAYLVGRDTRQDKLGPLRLDQGAREISGLGARPLPTGVRT